MTLLVVVWMFFSNWKSYTYRKSIITRRKDLATVVIVQSLENARFAYQKKEEGYFIFIFYVNKFAKIIFLMSDILFILLLYM